MKKITMVYKFTDGNHTMTDEWRDLSVDEFRKKLFEQLDFPPGDFEEAKTVLARYTNDAEYIEQQTERWPKAKALFDKLTGFAENWNVDGATAEKIDENSMINIYVRM